jgi:hypothetical protein
MFGELAANMRSFQAGTEKHRARLYVGHDGSMIRLAAGLGLGHSSPLRGPAMGSELIFEVCHLLTHYMWTADSPCVLCRSGDRRPAERSTCE